MELLAHLDSSESKALPALRELLGSVTEVFESDQDRYFSFHPAGVAVLFREGRLKTAFLYSDGVDGFSAYPGEIPFGITFGDSEAAAISKVERAPASEGSIRGLPFPKRSESSWVRFTLPTYLLHLEFRDYARTALRLVTISHRDPASAGEN